MPYTPLDKSTAKAAPATMLGDPSTVDNGLSFQDLIDELQKRLFNRTDVDATRLALFVNLAYTDMCSSLNLDDMKASLSIVMDSGQPLYLLPRAVATIRQIAVVEPEAESADEGKKLDQIDLEVYRGRPAEDGGAREWFRYTGMLVTYPTVDFAGASLTIDFRIRPVWPTTPATQWPILETEWHEGIVLLAKNKALEALAEPEMAAVAQNEYVNFVRRRLDYAAEDKSKVPGRSSAPRSSVMLRERRQRVAPWRRP